MISFFNDVCDFTVDSSVIYRFACLFTKQFKNEADFFKLLFDKHLSTVKTKEFEKVIKNNFEGQSSIVFDTIINDLILNSKKSFIIDYLTNAILLLLDFILSFHQRLSNKSTLQFDYSIFFHKTSKGLKLITDRINKQY